MEFEGLEINTVSTHLTHYSPLIQPQLTRPKWNMGEIFGLKFHICIICTLMSVRLWNFKDGGS